MNTFFYFAPYYVLAMLVILTIATATIFFKHKNTENVLIVAGFVVKTSTLITNLFFGYGASFYHEGNLIAETKGLLSLNQIQTLQLIATLLLAIGFSIKAYKVVKKT